MLSSTSSAIGKKKLKFLILWSICSFFIVNFFETVYWMAEKDLENVWSSRFSNEKTMLHSTFSVDRHRQILLAFLLNIIGKEWVINCMSDGESIRCKNLSNIHLYIFILLCYTLSENFPIGHQGYHLEPIRKKKRCYTREKTRCYKISFILVFLRLWRNW